LPNIWDSGADEHRALRATTHAAAKFWSLVGTCCTPVKAFKHEEQANKQSLGDVVGTRRFRVETAGDRSTSWSHPLAISRSDRSFAGNPGERTMTTADRRYENLEITPVDARTWRSLFRYCIEFFKKRVFPAALLLSQQASPAASSKRRLIGAVHGDAAQSKL
jgi:hypothetical protein